MLTACRPPGPYFPERVQPSWQWQSGQPFPGAGTESGHARQVASEVAEADRPHQPGKVSAQPDGGILAGGIRVDHGDQKDRGLGQWRHDRLGLGKFSRLGAHPLIFPYGRGPLPGTWPEWPCRPRGCCEQAASGEVR